MTAHLGSTLLAKHNKVMTVMFSDKFITHNTQFCSQVLQWSNEEKTFKLKESDKYIWQPKLPVAFDPIFTAYGWMVRCIMLLLFVIQTELDVNKKKEKKRKKSAHHDR